MMISRNLLSFSDVPAQVLGTFGLECSIQFIGQIATLLAIRSSACMRPRNTADAA